MLFFVQLTNCAIHCTVNTVLYTTVYKLCCSHNVAISSQIRLLIMVYSFRKTNFMWKIIVQLFKKISLKVCTLEHTVVAMFLQFWCSKPSFLGAPLKKMSPICLTVLTLVVYKQRDKKSIYIDQFMNLWIISEYSDPADSIYLPLLSGLLIYFLYSNIKLKFFIHFYNFYSKWTSRSIELNPGQSNEIVIF